MGPFLTVIVPTQGRATLPRVLTSVREQVGPEQADIVVVADTHGKLLSDVADVAGRFKARYVEHDAGHHCWGHCQINEVLAQVRTPYVSFNDDDDVYAPGAFYAIWMALMSRDTAGPTLFQFKTHHDGRVVWDEPVLGEGRIGGHCIVTPSRRVGRWTCRYEGDFDFIADTVAMYPASQVMWVPRVIAHARPH